MNSPLNASDYQKAPFSDNQASCKNTPRKGENLIDLSSKNDDLKTGLNFYPER